MKDTALDKLGNLLKSMTVSDVKGGNVVLFAPVKISAAIAAEAAKKRLTICPRQVTSNIN